MENRFKCGDNKCLSMKSVCNGVAECFDGEDEEECEGIRSISNLNLGYYLQYENNNFIL